MEQIKISEKMAEYVENLEQVERILNQCEYDLKYIVLKDNQRIYNLYINDICFKYFEGIGNKPLNEENKQDKILNAIWCLLSDRQCVINSRDFYDFVCEYGYNENAEQLKKGKEIYEAIKINNEKLLKCFSNEQLDFLTDNIQL